MRWAVDAAGMRAIDSAAIARGIPSLDLMERAGTAVAEVALGLGEAGPIVVLCGPGNNGGDGLVAARVLRDRGRDVEAILLALPDKLSPDTAVNHRRALEAGVPIEVVADEVGLDLLASRLARAGLVVDALLGTGSRGAPRGLIGAVVRLISSARVVLAVDLPTGLDSDTGQAPGPVVRAHATVTMGLPKLGMLVHPGCVLVGELTVADIGFPSDLVCPPAKGVMILERGDVATFLPRIPSTAHKGECGKVLVVAGSVGMTGAAALCCEAALRTGAGLVYLAIPSTLNPILESLLPETITVPLPCVDDQHCAAGFEALRRRLEGVDVVVVGPGLGRGPGPGEMVRRVMDEWRGPLVVDADGLFHLSREATLRENVILTPHMGEMERLTGAGALAIRADLFTAARTESARRKAVLLLKGVPTIVASPSGDCGVNLTGNAGLAKGGSGDVLAGVIAGLLGQGAEPFRAALAAAFIHGLAADRAVEGLPHAAVLPRDLVRLLPDALAAAGYGDRGEPVPWWKRRGSPVAVGSSGSRDVGSEPQEP